MYTHRNIANMFLGLLLLIPITIWFSIEFYRLPLDLLSEHFYLLQVLELPPTSGIINIMKALQWGGLILYAYLMLVIIPQRFSGASHPVYWSFTAITLIGLRLWTLLAIPSVESWLSTLLGVTFPADRLWLVAVIGYSILLGPVCLLFMLFIPRPKLFSPMQSLGRYILAIFMGVSCALFVQLLLSFLDLILPQEVADILFFYHSNSSGWDNMVYLLICIPFLEEIAFRGILQGLLQKRWPALLAILTASLFSAFWYGNFSLFCCMLMISLSCGIYYYYTQRVRYCITAHCTANYVSILFYSTDHGPVFSQLLTLFAELSPYVKLFLMIASLLVILGIIRIVRKS